jgi:Low-density lipoprotein receptor domain class A
MEHGHCLDMTLRCDDTDDCGDRFNEREDVCLSECPADFFKCSSGQCISKEFECNSYVDCKDTSDEHAECRKYFNTF